MGVPLYGTKGCHVPPSLESLPLGLHSPVLDRARELRERAGRREAGRFLIEGPTLLADALAAGRRPAAVFATTEALAALAPAVRDALRGVAVYEVPARGIGRLSELQTPPGLVAEIATDLHEPGALFEAAAGAPVAILAGVADPGNAGTLLRSAEIFGIAHVVFAEGGVEPYHPKVVRAAMGGHFRCKLAAGAGATVLAGARSAGYTVVAAATDGEPLPGFGFPPRCAIAIGSERHGPGHALPGWDRSVAIPHRGAGESLNAAVAGSIIFYALSLQTEAAARERSGD